MKLPFKNLGLKKGTQNLRRKSFLWESKNNPWVSSKRAWRKLPLWGKVGAATVAVGSKVAFIGLGYYGGKKAGKENSQPKKYMKG